jgi:hypothetical protein
VDYEDRILRIQQEMKAPAAHAKTFFSRANEYRYFVKDIVESNWATLDLSDPENWKHVEFDMHVFAYSGIGKGQRFQASFATGMFAPIDEGGVVESDNVEIISDDEEEEDLIDFYYGSDSEDDSDFDSDFDEDALSSGSEEDSLGGSFDEDDPDHIDEQDDVKVLGAPTGPSYEGTFNAESTDLWSCSKQEGENKEGPG